MFPVVLNQYSRPRFFRGTTMQIKLHSFFVLSLQSHLMEKFFILGFNFKEFFQF